VNCGAVLIVGLGVKTTRGCSLSGADPAVGGQETAGTGGESEARNRGFSAGIGLRIGVGDLFETGLEAADCRRSAGLYGLGLDRR
jgi:hypothetical protein